MHECNDTDCMFYQEQRVFETACEMVRNLLRHAPNDETLVYMTRSQLLILQEVLSDYARVEGWDNT